MKKLLSILAAVGLTATASTAVVACGSSDGVDNSTNNPSHTYNEFMNWVDASKDNKETELIVIGGRTDSDTASWLGARESAITGKANVSDLNSDDSDSILNSSHIDNIDSKFSDWAKGDQTINDMIKFINNFVPNDNKSKNLLDNFWGENPKLTNNISLHTIMVDNITNFFDNGLGLTGIINKFMNQQVKDLNTFAHSGNWDDKPAMGNKDKAIKREISERTKSIASTLKGKTGPFFLVINNGKLSGIASGFKNYTEFNKDVHDKKNANGLNHDNAVADINTLFTTFQTTIWTNLQQWLIGNWLPKDAQSQTDFVRINKTDIKSWSDIAGLNGTVNKDNSANDDTGKKDVKAYALDVTKYMD